MRRGRGELNRARHVVDVTTAVVVENRRAHRQGVGDQGNVDRRVDVRVGIAARGDAVACVHVAFGDIELRLVRDVAKDTRLGAAAEQGALRTFQHFDALHVDHVDVVVSRRELHGLVIQVQRHVREGGGGRLRLIARAAGAQTAHEYVAGAGAIAAERDVRGIAQQIVEAGHVELFELLAGHGLDGDGDVLDAFRAALRRDGDLLDALGVAGVGCRLSEGHGERQTAQNGGNRVRQLRI